MTDAIASLLAEQQVLAYRYQGVRYDCGSKLGYLQATVEFGQRHAEVGKEFQDYLAQPRGEEWTMNLQPVILCGGSGTRLWPLSREQYPEAAAGARRRPRPCCRPRR